MPVANADRVRELFDTPGAQVFHSLHLDAPAPIGPLAVTSLPWAFERDGIRYAPERDLVEVAEPVGTSAVNRDRYTFALNAHDYPDIVANGAAARGSRVQVWQGFAVNGTPQLGPGDWLEIYAGRVSAVSVQATATEARLVVSCGNALPALDSVTGQRTTRAAQSAIDPADGCFDRVGQGSFQRAIRWG